MCADSCVLPGHEGSAAGPHYATTSCQAHCPSQLTAGHVHCVLSQQAATLSSVSETSESGPAACWTSWSQRSRCLTAAQSITQLLQFLQVSKASNKKVTHHITNGGDVSDSHLVYSVLLTAISIKETEQGDADKWMELIRSCGWRPSSNPRRRDTDNHAAGVVRLCSHCWSAFILFTHVSKTVRLETTGV